MGKKQRIHYPLLAMTVLGTVLMLLAALLRIHVDTDIVDSLPSQDGVLADAAYIFKHHPVQDQIALDIGLDHEDKDLLVRLAADAEMLLAESNIFVKVGMNEMQDLIPLLISHVVDRMPMLFTAAELENRVGPLLDPRSVKSRLNALHRSLMEIDSIGQAGFMARDPLGLRDLKLAQLTSMVPSQNAGIYKGKLVSNDGRHVMVLAQPEGSGTDTALARRLTALIDQVGKELKNRYGTANARITLTPVGAYRAALDNEDIVRNDVNRAVILATLGIAILLLLAFPRPLIGLLALVPAIAGTTAALFVFSLIRESISIMALGFGGAVISITVDHGIAYLLFLDRPHETFGRQASREVWAIGLLAALTTIGAFSVLSFSGFPIFEQLGIFTAMGIAFSFMFVHTLFPLIFPSMPPAVSSRKRPLQNWVDRLAGLGPRGAWAALLVFALLLIWVRPQFNVNLSAMNTVSENTERAEKRFSEVWGHLFNKTFVMMEAGTLEALQEKGDALLSTLDNAVAGKVIEPVFVPARIFPGSSLGKANVSAWQAFWSPERVAALRAVMVPAAADLGFARDAFEPFFRRLDASFEAILPLPIAPELLTLMGISKSKEGRIWRQFTGVTPASRYDGQRFYDRISGLAKVFDSGLFSDKMGRFLFSTFSRMLLIVGISIAGLLFIFFADWQLTLISLLPIGFSLVCTLGTLTIMGRSLDIPALMLASIVLGMGIDYSLFFVRSYQRYQHSGHRHFKLIRMAVFMASASTLVGFGTLCSAEHSLLQSAGITSLLGIGFSLLGTFIILPPVMERRFRKEVNVFSGQTSTLGGVQMRYRNMEVYPRMFARFKLRLDPMFNELEKLLPQPVDKMGTILDIGSGYGVPACWLTHHYPGARIYGIEPEADRVRVANLALGSNGKIIQGLAPQVPSAPAAADAVFMLDMCHFLSDDAFDLTLDRLSRQMKDHARLVMRIVLVPQRKFPWTWFIENAKMKAQGLPAYYRSSDTVIEHIRRHPFEIVTVQPSGARDELVWVIARR